jgi:hypothetical protein
MSETRSVDQLLVHEPWQLSDQPGPQVGLGLLVNHDNDDDSNIDPKTDYPSSAGSVDPEATTASPTSIDGTPSKSLTVSTPMPSEAVDKLAQLGYAAGICAVTRIPGTETGQSVQRSHILPRKAVKDIRRVSYS